MKNNIVILLLLLVMLSLCGCNKQEEVVQDDSPITMSVSLGNNSAYYNELKTVIQEELGIEIQFIYQSALDTSNAVVLEYKNNDAPADIIATAAPVKEEYLKDSTLDLMSYTHMSDYFTYQKMQDVTNADGTVYQLPYTTRLIGITYNKTLLEEMGWEVPTCYEDMLTLKQKCDEEGILFAVSAGVATGHGFNYLFHTMGTQWLSTLDGSQWIKDFLNGESDISAFQEQVSYFIDWVENGLFGNLHNTDWNASKEYCSRRALFFFDLTNSIYSYEGDIVDENGNVIGQVKDEYKSIPWISKNGDNNRYTYYDNMYLSLNKKLGDKNQENRLKQCIEILEFMTSDKVTSIFKNMYEDGYVSVKKFEIDESRDYYGSKEDIENGYLMPWYYSYFDIDSIVQVGQCVNNYILDRSSSMEDVLNTLLEYRDKYVNQEVAHICDIEETLSYSDVARLNCIASLNAYQLKLDELGMKETATVALVPYVDDLSDLMAYSSIGCVSTKAYEGEFLENDIRTIIPSKGENVFGIYLKGSEIKELIENGVTEIDHVYAYMTSDYEELNDKDTYLIVIAKANLSEGLYNQYLKNNQVLSVDEKPLSVSITSSLKEYALAHPTLSKQVLYE